jgi:hypothetical protein
MPLTNYYAEGNIIGADTREAGAGEHKFTCVIKPGIMSYSQRPLQTIQWHAVAYSMVHVGTREKLNSWH